MKTIIIEDNEADFNKLLKLLERYCPNLVIAGRAKDISTAREMIIRETPRLVFMDIELNGHTSFDLLRELRNTMWNFSVIFITAFHQYALQALDFAAVDYLLKEDLHNDREKLVKAVKKVQQANQTLWDNIRMRSVILTRPETELFTTSIVLSSRESRRLIMKMELMYVESKGQKCFFYVSSGNHSQVSGYLNKFEDKLTPDIFIRCHQSFYVNKFHIEQFDLSQEKIILRNGVKIPVGRKFRKDIQGFFSLAEM